MLLRNSTDFVLIGFGMQQLELTMWELLCKTAEPHLFFKFHWESQKVNIRYDHLYSSTKPELLWAMFLVISYKKVVFRNSSPCFLKYILGLSCLCHGQSSPVDLPVVFACVWSLLFSPRLTVCLFIFCVEAFPHFRKSGRWVASDLELFSHWTQPRLQLIASPAAKCTLGGLGWNGISKCGILCILLYWK